MHRKTAAALMLLTFLAVTTIAVAQGPGAGMRIYDPKTEVTLTGSVEGVQQQPCMGRRVGTHLTLKTESETLDVCVGPTGYVQQKGFSFAKGDQIEVVGSRVKLGEKDAIVARQIKKGDQTLTLRDSQGIPAWSGGRRNY